MERRIIPATENDREQVLGLYRSQIGREFCPWSDHYPGDQEITFDLSRDSLFVMKDENGRVISAISIDLDQNVEELPCWSKELAPGGELSRLAVSSDYQNQGIAREMILYAMQVLRDRGYRSVHFLVNRLNTKAVRSYDHLNFCHVGSCELYDQPFWCYEKEL